MSRKFRDNIEIISSAANTSGLRTNNLTSSSPVTAGAKTIGVDANGVVVTVDAITGTTLFTLSDGTNTQAIAGGDTFTINTGNGLTATISATDLLTIVAKLSTDAGNDITFGSDGGLYLSKDSLLTNVTWNDATNNLILTFDNGSTVNVPIIDNVSTFLMDLVISDGTNTDVVNNHETLTFATNTNLSSVSKFEIGGNLVTLTSEFATATAGDTYIYDGTKVVWGKPTANRYINAYTPTANVATTHTHGLTTNWPVVQVFDTATGEVIGAEIVRISGTQFTVLVTTADPITVVAL